jgi:voltage-gated potassium channel
MLEKIKYRVYDVLVETDDNEVADKVVAVMLMILIVINVIAVILESVDEINQAYGTIFYAVEVVSVAIFSFEYILRLWVAPLTTRFAKPVMGRIHYAMTPLALIDLLAILPAFLPLVFALDLRIIRFLRIFRLFRLFKMSRYVESLDTLDDVVKSRKEELIVTLVMIMMLLVFSASLMYVVENEAQPDKFPHIPSALWWGVATLTTVGYGDVFPVTPLGKLFGSFIAFLGIGIFALPTGILASGFAEEIKKRREKYEQNKVYDCPHCGKDVSAIVTDGK